MNDELESNSAGGSAGQPNSQASDGKNDKPPSVDVNSLWKQLEPLIETKFQSVKDKRLGKLEREVGEVTTVLERFKGIVPDEKLREIQKDLEFEDLKRRVYGENPTTATPAGGTSDGVQGKVDVLGIAKQLNLDANDKDIAAALSKGDVVELVKVAVSKASTPSPSAGDAPPLLGGERKPEPAEALKAEYQTRLAKIQRGDVWAISQLQSEFRKKGLTL